MCGALVLELSAGICSLKVDMLPTGKNQLRFAHEGQKDLVERQFELIQNVRLAIKSLKIHIVTGKFWRGHMCGHILELFELISCCVKRKLRK